MDNKHLDELIKSEISKIELLKELQEYRSIGTVDEFRNLKETQDRILNNIDNM